MRTNLVNIILWQSLAIFLLIGALMGLILGLLLILKPHLIGHLNRIASRWVSSSRLNQLLDRSVSIEQWLYQHHRPLGIFATFGACYILVYFGLLFDKTAAMQYWAGSMPAIQLDILLDAMVLVALICAVVALLVGLFLWLRPSMLRGIEESANQWVSTDRTFRVLDIPHDEVERFVAGHTRRVGWLLLLGSIGLLFILFRWLM